MKSLTCSALELERHSCSLYLQCLYSPNELRYLPLNTALYEPPLDPELPALDSDGDSDDAEYERGDENRKHKASVRFEIYI
ncbi:UNVERIFIED_CONTAM: hypothetical protein FKN15_041123 [Acipenser sinensis]